MMDELKPLADGLDLYDSEDRSIFRLRIREHFSMMRKRWLLSAASMRTGTRGQATNAIANRYIARTIGLTPSALCGDR